MNTSFYISMKALWSDRRDPSSSPPQYSRTWVKVWWTLSFLGILLMPSVQAQTGAALNFDGTNDHVTFPTAGLSPSAGTMEFWVNTVSNGSTQMYIDLYQEQFTIYSTGTTLRARIAGTDLSAPFTPGQWNHLALTWSGNGTTARLYLNGVQVATGTQGSTPISSSIGYLSRSQGTNAYFVNCTMDEVRLWSVARTATEIATNYCSEIATNSTGLQTYYKFGQGTVGANNAGVTSLTDATSNGRNGSLVNFGLTGSTSNWVASNTWAGFITPSVAIAGSPSGSIVYGTSVTFTATPTNGGSAPTYQWKKNNVNVGTNSATYTDAALNNNDVITCVMTSNATCASPATATSNSVTMTVTYPAGAALNFDGSNDHVTAPAGVYFNGNLTIEAWVYPRSHAFWARIIDFGNGTTDNVFLALSYEGTGKPNFNIGGVDLSSTQTLTLNQWNHVAATLNGTTATIYINGIAAGTRTLPIPANVVRNNCYIGKSNWPDAAADVVMDELRIWSRALPQCEIQNNMNCELGSGQTGLTAYYKFNQGFGSTSNAGVTSLTDASGNNRTGTLTNFGLTGTTSNWVSTGGVTTGTTCTAYTAPSVAIAGSPSGSIVYGTSVTFTATPTNGGATPTYQWKKNGTNVGTNSTTYTDAALNNSDVLTCVLTNACGATATSNSVTMTVTYPAGAALHFDGVNDYVAAPSGVYFNGDLTIEAWINPKNNATNSRIIDFGNGPDANNVLLIAYGGAGKPVFSIVGVGDLVATQSLAVNTWSHVAVTLKGTTATFYINGVVAGTGTINSPPANVTRNNCYIGRSNWSGDAYANANMDEIRIWSRALPQCEIQNNMSCELGVTQTGLAAYYKFNQGSGFTSNAGMTTLTDASGNNRNGTLTNFGLTGTTSNWISTGGVTTGTTCTPLPVPSVAIAVTTGSQTTCTGSSVTFTATPTNGGTTPTYQWRNGGVNISGATSATYTSTTLANNDAITCVLTSNAICATTTTATSNSLTMTVNPLVTPSVSIAITTGSQTMCAGASVTFTATPTNGGTTPSYQWKNNGTDISGATNATYTSTSLANTDAITCVMTSNATCPSPATATSNSLTMTVNPLVTPSVAIAVTTGSQTMCAGASVTFTATPTNGGTTPTYQWRKNSVNISGATSATYTSTTLVNSDTITCVLTSNVACASTTTATSNSLIMTVNPLVTPSVSIAVTTGSQTTCAGASVTFTATPTNGGTTPMYQWRNGSVNISGATSATYTSTTLANNDAITCVMTSNATCPSTPTATSNSLTMTVNPLVTPSVSIAVTTGSQTTCAGASVTFTATPTNGGTTPTYQWKKGGVDISGATSVTYTSTTLANNDAITCVLTSNATCANPTTATSNSLTMTVNPTVTPSVAIAVTTGSQTMCASASVTFTATPTNGGTTPSYQWKNNGTNISGATNATYTSTTLANSDAITCVMTSNATCPSPATATSNSLIMTVNPLVTPSVSIAVTTGSQTTCAGASASVTFTATPMNGGTTPTYQWKKNGSDISGATNATYTSTALANNDAITCVMTSNATCPSTPTATSNSLTITVNPIVTPSVAIAASATTVAYGTSVTFTATPTNGGTSPFYQWKKNGVNIGTNSATYTSTDLLNGDVITCVMTAVGVCASSATATSNAVTMTVTGLPPASALNFDGLNDYVAAPAGVYFNGDLTIEAWINPKNNATHSRIIDFGNGPDAKNVLLIASGGAGKPVFSIVGVGQLVATQSLAVNTWNHVAVTLKGKTATFYINGVVAGTGTINSPPANVTRNNCYIGRSNWSSDPYANARMDEIRLWSRALPQCEIQNNMNGELGSGQTGLLAYYKFNQGNSNSNNAADTTLTDASGNNRHAKLKGFGLTGTSSNWVAPGGVSTGTTSPAYVTPSVSVNSATACINTATTLTATATGFASTVTYQWESSADNITWSVIAGATTTAYSPPTSTASTRYFRLKATDACGAVYSTGATFTVTNPGLTVTADATQACQGSTVTLTAATVTGTPTYQWQSSADGNAWTNVSGATAATFAPATSTLGTLSYRVVASYGSVCTLNSTAQTLTVTAAPTASATGGNVTVGLGSSTGSLTAVINSSFASVFQWQSSTDGSTGWTDIANSNVLTYTPSTEVVGTLYYRLKVTFAATESVCNATIYSNSRKVTVESAPIVTITPTGGASQRLLAGETIACAGTNLTLTSTCTDATATPSWTGPNGFTASTANITLSNLTSAQSGKYRVIYLTATGYIGEQTTTLNVRPTLGVTKTVSNASITSGSSSQIVVTGKYSQGVVSKIKFGTSSIRYLATRDAAIGSSPVNETTNDNSINQDWLFIPVAGGTVNFSAGSSQKYYIQSVYSGLYLSASATNSAVVQMGLLNNSTNFEWTLALGSSNIIVLRNGNQKALNNSSSSFSGLVSPSNLKASCFLASTTPTMTLAWNDGPTATTRTVSPTATTNYIATFTNSAGCAIKDTTTIAVVSSTTISITPSGNIPPVAGNQQRLSATNVCQNQPISLSATVSNNGNAATYQWQRSTNGTTWFDITGVTNLTYSPPTNNAGTFFYRVIVTNSLGIFTSDPAEIFVIAVPTISIATTQATVCPNATPTLTAGYTTGFGTPTIQWQSSPDSAAWTNISGATAETYQPVTTTAGKIFYRYIATFTGSCPTFTSKGVAITVKPVLTVGITGVVTQTVCQGSYRFFTLSSNDATATFAWQSSANGTTWATIANATSASYVAPTNTAGVTYYRGIVSAAGCSATSDTRQITTSAIPTVTVASPYSETCVDRPVSFTATLSSTSAGTPTFVWQTSNDNLNWATQATGSTYSPSAATVGSTYVRAGVKFAACTDSAFSVPKTLLSNANPIVTVSVNPTAPCSNVATVLTANLIGGSSSPTYQWQRTFFFGGTAWSNISGATSSSYTIPAGTDANKYRVQVQYNTYCPVVFSQGVVVIPKTAPSVTIAASGTAICQGSTVSLTSAITKGVTNQTLQWQSSPDGTTWTNIAGATTASYNYTAATVGSTQYRLVVSVNGCSEVNSAATTIAVSSNTVPTLAISANNSTVCGATEIVVTATPANLNGVTPQYEWLRNGELFTGQPSSFSTKSTVDGLGSNVINDIAVAGKNVYLATDNGLAVSTDGGTTFTNKTTANGLPSNKILALGLHPDGERIIIGTDKGGVISTNKGSSFLSLSAPIKTKVVFNTTGAISNIGVSPNGSIAYISAQNTVWQFSNFNSIFDQTSGQVIANSIVFKNNTTAYLLTQNGVTIANGTTTPTFSQSPITSLPFKRAAFRGDTIFATNSTTGLNYFINNVQYAVTGLPAASTIQDVLVMDNIVYVTATSGLYVSKDGGKSFSDITSSVGLGSNPGLGRIVRSGSFIYLASGSGLRIASATSPTLTFTANKSDLIECQMTTTGVCTNTVSQLLTVNYIGDVDPTSIKVAVDGTTGTGTWTAVNNATGYGWELMKFSPDRSSKTFVKNGTVTTNSVTLSDLNPSSNYELTVKTLCNISSAFARLVDATGSGAGGSTSFTMGFVVPQVIRDSLLKASTLCAEDSLILGPGFPNDYEVNIYSGADKTYIDYASAVHPFKVKLTANTNYFYKVLKSDVKIYTFTASNNDAGSESKRYTVPTGVSKVTFKIAGSKGGGTNGGRGGVTIGTVTPTAGTTYHLFPGTTTTADAGKSRGTEVSFNGGGGSYISTTSLRKDAILVAGGGGASGSEATGGNGGQIGENGSSGVTGGNATTGGTSFTLTIPANRGTRTPSGFMQGSSIDKVTWNYKYDAGGGGGYYGGGSLLEAFVEPRGSKQAGGGGSSYANTAVVNSVLYENGTNNSTGYVTVYEYSQATANSDFLPLNIVLSPVPVLANAAITLNPAVPIRNTNFQATFSLTGNSGFSTSYRWSHSSQKSPVITLNFGYNIGLLGYADVKYCSNRQKTISTYRQVTLSGNIPPDDSSSNRGNRLLTPAVSIASSATNICGGEQVIFTATPTNVADENLSYTWYRNGEIVFGTSDNVLQTSDLANGDVIKCTLFYPSATTGTDSVVSTNTVTMTVATPANDSSISKRRLSRHSNYLHTDTDGWRNIPSVSLVSER